MEGEFTKQCCARLYESDLARILLGDSFHPGGLKLTERLGEVLGLAPESRVLDVACGKGTSAVFLAERFGCEVLGVDYSGKNVEHAREQVASMGVSARVHFERADAEALPVPDSTLDAVVCECAFCTFPNKAAAAREFVRVLRPAGRVGLSDLTRGPVLPTELEGLFAWLACIADARPVESYAACLRDAGLVVQDAEQHDEALTEMVDQVRRKLLGAEIMVGLKRLELPGVDFSTAKQMAQSALAAIRDGRLGYVVISAVKPCQSSSI